MQVRLEHASAYDLGRPDLALCASLDLFRSAGRLNPKTLNPKP